MYYINLETHLFYMDIPGQMNPHSFNIIPYLNAFIYPGVTTANEFAFIFPGISMLNRSIYI